MKRIAFDEEELLVLAILEPDTRRNTIHRLEEVLPEIKEDPDLEAIVISAAEKLKRISDKEFAGLDLDSYRKELEEEDENEDGIEGEKDADHDYAEGGGA